MDRSSHSLNSELVIKQRLKAKLSFVSFQLIPPHPDELIAYLSSIADWKFDFLIHKLINIVNRSLSNLSDLFLYLKGGPDMT